MNPINAHAPHARVDETHEKNVTGTPIKFVKAVEKSFVGRTFDWDLAATASNTKAVNFITPEEDSLSVDWRTLRGKLTTCQCFLNPPYAKIEPWVKKASEEATNNLHIWVLVPASVDSNWWTNYVENKADTVYWIKGRITFEGHEHSYPKPLALIHYSSVPILTRYTGWSWKKVTL